MDPSDAPIAELVDRIVEIRLKIEKSDDLDELQSLGEELDNIKSELNQRFLSDASNETSGSNKADGLGGLTDQWDYS